MQSPDQFTLSVLDLTSDSSLSSSQVHLVQLLRQTVVEHLPANDQQSIRTFWTVQSQTSEEKESWRQLRQKLRDLCSPDPSQLRTNQTRILNVLREYYSGDLLTDAFFEAEMEDIYNSDRDDNTLNKGTKTSIDQSLVTHKEGYPNPVRSGSSRGSTEEMFQVLDLRPNPGITPRMEREKRKLYVIREFKPEDMLAYPTKRHFTGQPLGAYGATKTLTSKFRDSKRWDTNRRNL
jgi:hypothetical protein